MPKKAAMFIAFQGFRDEEYLEPKKILEEAGIKVVTVSTSRGLARGKLGATAEVDLTADEIDPADYDALMLVGGPGTLEHLDKPKVHEIFRKAGSWAKRSARSASLRWCWRTPACSKAKRPPFSRTGPPRLKKRGPFTPRRTCLRTGTS